MTKRLWIAFGWMLCLAYGASAEETEYSPPADPQRATQIRKWVEGLGDADYRVREQSENSIREAGKEAAFALIPVAQGASDIEIAEKAKALLREMGVATPAERKEIRRLIEQLKAIRDPEEWETAWERLKTHGDPARDAWEEVCKSGSGEAKMEIRVSSESAKIGKPVSYEIRIRNTGESGIWITPSSIQAETSRRLFHEEREPENLARGYESGLKDAQRQMAVARRRLQQIWKNRPAGLPGAMPAIGIGGEDLYSGAFFVWIPPGEAFVLERGIGTEETDWFGILSLQAAYQPEKGNPLNPGDPDGWPTPVPAPLELSHRKEVPLAPDTGEEKNENRVEGWSVDLEVVGEVENELRCRMGWNNRSNVSQKVVPYPNVGEKEIRVGYVVLDPDGNVVQSGAADLPEAAPLKEREVAPGETLHADFRIPAPKGRGPFRVSAGLCVRNPNPLAGLFSAMPMGTLEMRTANPPAAPAEPEKEKKKEARDPQRGMRRGTEPASPDLLNRISPEPHRLYVTPLKRWIPSEN